MDAINNISAPIAGICGGRYLTAKWLPLASRIGRGALADGLTLATGCCIGADALIMSASLIGGWADRLEVLAAFGPDGAGAVDASALNLVQLTAAAGANVRWWIGGGPTMPPAARLIRRTTALAHYTGGHKGAPMIGLLDRTCPSGIGPTGRKRKGGEGSGSWAALATAAERGRQIFVFWCSDAAPNLPAHWGGDWRPVRQGWLRDAWEWTPPGQATLF